MKKIILIFLCFTIKLYSQKCFTKNEPKLLTSNCLQRTVKWDGSSNEGYIEGKGTLMVYENSALLYTFIGNIKKGVIDGNGRMKFENPTEVYEGNFQDGVRKGKGKFLYSSGSVYDGMWLNDKFDGYGKLILPNGNFYEGNWEDGDMSGYGKLH